MSDEKKMVKVTWDGELQISKGDEIEILRGIVINENLIKASKLRNITRGRKEVCDIEGVRGKTKEIEPSLRGVVEKIEAYSDWTEFDLIVGSGLIEVGLGSLLKEASRFLDPEIVEKCVYKQDAEDILTSAFRILEERIRAKIGAKPECCSTDLVKEAFNPQTGKLVFGDTEAERQGLLLLFMSSFMLFRNPSAHRFIKEYSEFEIFEMVCLVNLLLNILEKSQTRIEQQKETEKPVKKPSRKMEKRALKRDYSIKIAEEIYGELFRDVKGIIRSLENKYYSGLSFSKWGQFQEDHRYFMVDEKFRNRLDTFSKQIEGYNQACYRFNNRILPNIVKQGIRSVFNLETEDKPSFNVKYNQNNKNYSTSIILIEKLSKKLSISDIMDDALRHVDKSKISNVEVNISFLKSDRSSRFNSSEMEKIKMFWELCLKKMNEHETYNFIIEENDKLLEEAKKLKKEIAKRIQEQLRG